MHLKSLSLILLYFAIIAIQSKINLADDVANCKNNSNKYDYQIGLEVPNDAATINKLVDYLKKEFRVYLIHEYVEYLQSLINYDIYVCSVDDMSSSLNRVNIQIKLKKDDFDDQQNKFFDTILLEMISINKRKIEKDNNQLKYKIKEIWGTPIESKPYNLPIWAITLLVTGSTIIVASFLLVLREVFDCSKEVEKSSMTSKSNGIEPSSVGDTASNNQTSSSINNLYPPNTSKSTISDQNDNQTTRVVATENSVTSNNVVNTVKSTSNVKNRQVVEEMTYESIENAERWKQRRAIKSIENNYDNIDCSSNDGYSVGSNEIRESSI